MRNYHCCILMVLEPACLSWLLYSWCFDPCTFRASSYSVTILDLFLEFLSLRYRISVPWQLGIDLWMSTSTCSSFLILSENCKAGKIDEFSSEFRQHCHLVKCKRLRDVEHELFMICIKIVLSGNNQNRYSWV